METKYTRNKLLLMKKKQLVNLLGYKNIKDYYKQTGETGKISRKQLVSHILMLQRMA